MSTYVAHARNDTSGTAMYAQPDASFPTPPAFDSQDEIVTPLRFVSSAVNADFLNNQAQNIVAFCPSLRVTLFMLYINSQLSRVQFLLLGFLSTKVKSC